MMRLAASLVGLLLLLSPAAAPAHELRPAYLEMRELAGDRFAVLWKVPALGDRQLGLYVNLPAVCSGTVPARTRLEGTAATARWTVACAGGLKGETVGINGLRTTLTDVLVRIAYWDGSTQVARLTPESPSMVISGVQSPVEVSGTYFALGVEHILFGLDHLLFVLALLLLIDRSWILVKTITAFTAAHSLTLGAATLGYVSLPQAPVEAVIALSIVFLATELTERGAGEARLSARAPWLVAFAFGLLHGFGFAGALRDVGLPQQDVPLALLTFNLGVEAGQLLFVGAAIVVMTSLRAIATPPAAPARRLAAYAIGTISAFWLIERLASFA